MTGYTGWSHHGVVAILRFSDALREQAALRTAVITISLLAELVRLPYKIVRIAFAKTRYLGSSSAMH